MKPITFRHKPAT